MGTTPLAKWLFRLGVGVVAVLLLAGAARFVRDWRETDRRLSFACERLGLPRSALDSGALGCLTAWHASDSHGPRVVVIADPGRPGLRYQFFATTSWSKEFAGHAEIDAARAGEIATKAAERYLGTASGDVRIEAVAPKYRGTEWEVEMTFTSTPADWIPRRASVTVGKRGHVVAVDAPPQR